MIEIKSEVKGIFCGAVLVKNVSGTIYTDFQFSSKGSHINFEDYKINGFDTEKMILVNKQDPKEVIEVEINFTLKSRKPK